MYRARDTRLDRTVAIKVLTSHLSDNPELKQRFEREAKAISSLNHPNICTLHDVGSQDGVDFLVMEFLEGETLTGRLLKGPMPLNEILKVGIAVAEALAVAHSNGIVHRDLKPGNIMLTRVGAKLMDFGLAKPLGTAAAPLGSGWTPPSFTATTAMSGPSPLSPLTTAGSFIGTIQYMSPEQIEGREAGARSDIFALGAVMYEMVAGKRPFEGKTQISLASSILESDPEPVSKLRLGTPPAFEHVVATCLQKNPDDRYQTAHDIKLELQWILAQMSSPAVTTVAPSLFHTRERIAWAAAVTAIALSVVALVLLNRANPTASSTRTAIDPPAKTALNLTGDFAGPPVLSPDGASIAFTAAGADGKTALWVRPMNFMEARMLPGTEGAIFPFWSPDGRSLGFFANMKLITVNLNGGAPLVVCDAPFGRGGAWGPGGVILFTPSTQSPIMRVSATGGTPVPVTKIDLAQHTSHRWPFFLPDGKHFLYLAINHDPARAANDTLYYASLDGRENRPLLPSQSNAVYGSGFVLFARGDRLMAQSFDPDRGTLGGEAQDLANGVVDDISTWHMDASASNNGLLVFGNGGTADWQLVWMDRNGKQIGTAADNLANLQIARLSPQGDRIALQIDTGLSDIWVLDLARGIRTRLTSGPVSSTYPAWSRDGKWIAYTSERNGHSMLYRRPSDGSRAEELLLTDEQVAQISDWSPDGKYLIYQRGPSGKWEVWALPVEGERKPWLIVPHVGNSGSSQGTLSPDGRWLAFSSTESGTSQVYVVPFRGGQGKWQVSTNDGGAAHWRGDGKELYYMSANARTVFAVPVKESNGTLQFGAPQALATNPASFGGGIYDVSPDGKKILLNVVSHQVSQSVTVVTNFPAGLKK